MSDQAIAPLFCAAPWLESVVRMDGTVLPCCRSDRSLGTLQQAPLADIWRGQVASEFRSEIRNGRYPSDTCAACHKAQKHTTLRKVIEPLIDQFWTAYTGCIDQVGVVFHQNLCHSIAAFKTAVVLNSRDSVSAAALHLVDLFDQEYANASSIVPAPLHKLRNLAVAAADYCAGSLQPRVVATLRQVSLVAVCNARCLHCVGLYNDEIRLGQINNGKRQKRIDDAALEAALDNPGDITSFFLNGSEFFLYPQWRAMLKRFEQSLIRVGIATNGLLMDDEAIAIVVGSTSVRDVNFSFDGATAETVEKIRHPVKFAELCATTVRFLQALDASQHAIPVSMSMVLMQRNRHEAAAFVALAHRLGQGRRNRPHVSFQVLDANVEPGYRIFRDQQYTDIDDTETRTQLIAAEHHARKLGVDVYYTYQGRLAQVLESDADACTGHDISSDASSTTAA